MIVVVLMMAEMRTMAHVQQSLRTLFTETTLSSHLCNWIIYAMPCITTRMARSQRMPRFRPAGMPIDWILVGWASSHPRNFYHKKPVFEEYRAQIASKKLKEVDDAYRDAAILLATNPQSYSSIIVDETQDFGPQALRLLRAMIPQDQNDLFFVGDGHQRIYTRNRSSMSASGINIKGRSRKLYLNYRTTEEIRRLAVATLEGCEVDDLDDGADEVVRYKSLSHGAIPKILDFKHLEDGLKALMPLLIKSNEESRSVCVIVPTRHDASTVFNNLKEVNILARILGPDERDQPDSKLVRIATMHRAKGLEFDEVVILLSRDWSSQKRNIDNARQLQYVAMTRAKKVATILKY
ncbi:AAA family ATPase [Polynucleobacter paneuropaeus]|nr:AAA family ATPase [Polynucleobacter paneuropaeus]